LDNAKINEYKEFNSEFFKSIDNLSMNAIYLSQQALSQTNMIVDMLEVILDKKSSIHSKIIFLNKLKKSQLDSVYNIENKNT